MITRRLVTTAVIDMIETATGLRCGRAVIPTAGDNGQAVIPPYYLLTPIDVTFDGPPLEDTNADAHMTYQVTGVSGPDPTIPQSAGTTEQAEWLGDTVRSAFLGRDPVTGAWVNGITVDGWRCTGRSIDTEPGATSDPGDAIISYVLRVRLDWTPA